jgi:Uma2 family endonuclease
MSIGTVPASQETLPPSFAPVSIQLAPVVPMTQEQFFDFCQLNADKRFERTAEGELIILPPSGGDSGFRDLSVSAQLYNWYMSIGKGKATGPSGGFILPNGANRAPDAAWLTPEQIASLTHEQRQRFLPLCPYFLIEVMSPSDVLTRMQEKMEEYIANGCQLGWLIDPARMQVHVYRPGQPVQVLDKPQTLAGDPELPGFVLDLEPVWQP